MKCCSFIGLKSSNSGIFRVNFGLRVYFIASRFVVNYIAAAYFLLFVKIKLTRSKIM